MKKFLKILMFDCLKKENRDIYGWHRVQAGLVIIMWLGVLTIFLSIVEITSCQ